MKAYNWDFLYLISTLELAWTGWWDEEKEGEIVSIPSSQPLSKQPFAPWYNGEPNGDIFQNCVALGKDGQWYDVSCADKFCDACQIQTVPTFVMKGRTLNKIIY